jgi:hypothetical protein
MKELLYTLFKCAFDSSPLLQDSKANSLGVANVGGIFVVLFVGLSLAVVTAIIEFVWNSRKRAARDRVSALVFLFTGSVIQFVAR